MKFLSILAVTSVLLVSCSEDGGSNNPAQPADLFPIHRGAQWVYNVESTRNDSLLYRSTDTLQIDTTSVIWAGSVWFNYRGVTGVHWRNGIDGVWRLKLDGTYPSGYAEKYYVYPARAGDKWSLPSDMDSVRVVSVREDVEVPVGAFAECTYYRIDRWDDSYRASLWVKPGVGVVQETSVTIAGGDTVRYSALLKSYRK